ncbi:MBL fold metallo-hydrolase [Chloroflexota bacterium]
MGGVSEVAENIYLIDDQLYSIPQYGSVYLINEEKKALIDTGPTTSAKVVLDGIESAGVRPEDIDYLIVTHIHLDHAGGAGVLIKDMPRARVLVHHKGARHMVSPEKLLNSVIEAQGEGYMERVGEVLPIEADRVKPVYGGDELRLGDGQLLQFIDAPGHAPHELCIYESRNNGLFAGDAVGLYINGTLLPITPSPSFDSELYVNTLRGLMELNVTKLYFAHFGTSSKVQKNLSLAINKIQAWDDMVTAAIKENNLDGAAQKMTAQRHAEIEPFRERESLYKQLSEMSIKLSVAGFIRYYREKIEAA